MMENNDYKLGEFGLFLTKWGVGIGFGVHHEDRRWENEIKIAIRQDWKGIKDFVIPYAWSAWKNKEVAHETWYNWGLISIFVDIPDIKTKCRLLRQ
jgi:hypothetical protein